MFEADARSNPQRNRARKYSAGDSVEGRVIRVGRDAVFLELDAQREGYIESIELKGDDGVVSVAVGDLVRAVVVSAQDEDGALRLAKVAPKGRGAEGLMSAMNAQLPVEGVVSGVNKGGLEVTVDSVRAFCPARQVDRSFVTDLSAFIGQRLQFLVMQVKDAGREVVLSRRAFLDREASEARAKMADKLVPMAVLRGRVTSTRDFGAFVDIGGVEALLPGSELSHDRSVRAADMVKVGDEIDVQILKIEPDERRPGQQRITLSLKSLATDPWESLAPKLEEGSVREGRVVRLADFGAFVQLAPGLDGLLHISELSGEVVADKAPSLPSVGATVAVRIIKVDLSQRRIALSPADAAPRDRASGAKAPSPTLRQGEIVSGKVSGVERFGVFLQIDGARARGLIPAQELSKTRGEDLNKHFAVGMPLKAKVVGIDASGKIRLSIEAMKQDEERASFEDFREREQDRSKGTLGALGQKLQAAGILAAKTTKLKKK
ncbi:MAG: 30S ribosomal protein S1 [Polyangiales bacterium]